MKALVWHGDRDVRLVDRPAELAKVLLSPA